MDAATVLMSTAQDSIDVLMQAPTSMATSSSGGRQTVHAQFRWGRFATGEWYVSAVSFGVNAPGAQLRLARQRALKERLLDKAELGMLDICTCVRWCSCGGPSGDLGEGRSPR